MFLVDTNIFLEILLKQERKEDCKRFLDNNIGNLNVSDFSLHSLGVILFRCDKHDIFQRFIEDIMPNVRFLSLPMRLYEEMKNSSKNLDLDFDDAYQYSTAKYYGLRVVTMDKDYEKIKDVEILFL